jgi:hypothetical protein
MLSFLKVLVGLSNMKRICGIVLSLTLMYVAAGFGSFMYRNASSSDSGYGAGDFYP